MSVAVAVSGGVDSLYALLSLREQGEACIALHALFLPPSLRSPGYGAMLERLALQCRVWDIPFHCVDLSTEFRAAVMEPFVRAYARGETPNPCALCNAAMKFGLLLDQAHALGADRLATGHYARLDLETAGAASLYTGLDAGKDQSYFLSLVPKERLAAALFPLGGLCKEEIRHYLAERGIAVPAPKESQEICFVPDDAYRAFIPGLAAELSLSLPGPGPVRLRDGREIGRHRGLWQYTEGQRKGLGIAWSHPLYVLEKDMVSNTLIVGSQEEMNDAAFCCDQVNYLVPRSKWPDAVLVRTRYRQTATPATVCKAAGNDDAGDTLVFRQSPPRGPYTAGQLATVYAPCPSEAERGAERGEGQGDALQVLAGGIIRRFA